jgi:biotin transporter BioY
MTSLELTEAFKAGALPFMVGDVVKSVLTAMLVAGSWAALNKQKR